jgi:two-component system sensor histidine kinase YesM
VDYLGELYSYSDIDVYTFFNGYVVSSNQTHNTTDYRQYPVSVSSWYQPVMNSVNDISIIGAYVPPGYKDKHKRIAVARKILSPDGSVSGLIVFSLNELYFGDLLFNERFFVKGYNQPSAIRSGTAGAFIVTDSNDGLVYNSNHDLEPYLAGNLKKIIGSGGTHTGIQLKGVQYSVIMIHSNVSGFNILYLRSNQSIEQSIAKIIHNVYWVVAVFIFVMLAISYLISKRITDPVKRLSNVMKKAELSKDTVISDTASNDEIGELGHSFNVMMNRFVESQFLRNEAELGALQQQINPHFLYNTLGVINSISQVYECNEITTISEKLADMFRYSINKDFHELVKVRDEIAHVENYLTIQQIRFGNKFDVDYHIDEAVLDCKMLKFLLQPLVENAVFHGLEKKADKGCLRIAGTADNGVLSFIISDDGVGMSQTELHRVREKLDFINIENMKHGENKDSIGLWNVNARVQLSYGNRFGLSIESEPGKGSMVKLVLPVLQ